MWKALLWIELIHYIAGFIACVFDPQSVMAFYLTSDVPQGPAAKDLITGVLAPFYLVCIVLVAAAIHTPLYRKVLALLCGDLSSLWTKSLHWTKEKTADTVIHIVLGCFYLTLLSSTANSIKDS